MDSAQLIMQRKPAVPAGTVSSLTTLPQPHLLEAVEQQVGRQRRGLLLGHTLVQGTPVARKRQAMLGVT